MDMLIGLTACLLVAVKSKGGRFFAAFLLAYYTAYAIFIEATGRSAQVTGEVFLLPEYIPLEYIGYALIDLSFCALLVALALWGKINKVFAIGYAIVIWSNILIGGVVAINQAAGSSSYVGVHATRQELALYLDLTFLALGTKAGGNTFKLVVELLLYGCCRWCNIVRIYSTNLFAGKGGAK